MGVKRNPSRLQIYLTPDGTGTRVVGWAECFGLLRAPEIVVRTWKAARQTIGDISEAEVWEALERLDADIGLRTAGLTSLFANLHAANLQARRAA